MAAPITVGVAATLLAALNNYSMESDLTRMRARFSRLAPAALDEEYGDSGETPNELLRRLEAHQDNIDAARAWVAAHSLT